MTVRVEFTAYGASALEILRTAVLDVKHADPMAPVTVIVANHAAAVVARRHLARGSADRPGIAGIEVTTLPRLAERLATPALAPRRPTTRPMLAAAIRRALAEDPGPFRDVADHPGTVRALAQAHTELRDVGDPARQSIAAAGELGKALIVVDEAVTVRLRQDWFDATDVLAALLAESPALVSARACCTSRRR